MPTNAQRRDLAFRTMLVYLSYKGEPLDVNEESITDLVTDLAHLGAEEYGLPVETLQSRIAMHLNAEGED